MRPVVLLVAGVVLLAIAVVASLALGARHVGVATLWQAWTHGDPGNADHAVVRSRLPRTVIGSLAGVALGLAGAALQGVARNPLADPGILGINAGASLSVVTALYVFGLTSPAGYVWFAFAGAGGAAVLVWVVAGLGREGATPVKLALAGAALNAVLVSLTNAVLVSSQLTLEQFRGWQVGSIAGRGLGSVDDLLPYLLVGGVVTLAAGRALNALALGDETATALGQHVGRARALVLLGVVLLCGVATALAGPISFVGLVVPHLMRSLVGGDYRWLLPLSAVFAPALLLVADVVGRLVAPPSEVQVGIMTAVVGAPFFVWLVRRRKAMQL